VDAVKRLTRPLSRYGSDLGTILSTKERTRFAATVSHAIKQARVYRKRSPRLHDIQTRVRRVPTRTFLIGLYDNDRVAVQRIKQRVRAALDPVTAARCQYCGLPSPTTLDHFLEKSKLSELAVFAPNLVPCCPYCNLHRGPAFKHDGTRRILHFYDDDVETMPHVLVATIAVHGGALVATFNVTPAAHPLVQVYQEHFAALHLKERYESEAAVLFSEIHHEIARAMPLTSIEVANLMLAKASDLDTIYGPNDFRATLYRALARSTNAIDWLTKSAP
jgi:5-methylcytosine-specific restriction endonuclease McrA